MVQMVFSSTKNAYDSFEFDRTTYFPASQSDVKLQVQVNGFNLERCSKIYQKGGINLSQKVLCAGGERGQDSCRGDSGQ